MIIEEENWRVVGERPRSSQRDIKRKKQWTTRDGEKGRERRREDG